MKISKIQEFEVPTADEAKNMPPMAALCAFWPIITIALNLVKIFTGAKADAKIDAVLEWGQLSCSLFAKENGTKDPNSSLG